MRRMALLRNLEQSLSGLVEGTIGRVFRTEVRPTEIARKLAREMEINKRVSLSRTYAPTDYLVYLSPDDRSRYAGVEGSIAEELGAYLLEHARRERLVLVRRPLVEFRTDQRLRLGEFGIEARTAPISAEEAPPRPDAVAAAPQAARRPASIQDRPREPSAQADAALRASAPEPRFDDGDQPRLGSTPASAGYEPPSAVGRVDDAPYEDPYSGDPFNAPEREPEPGDSGDDEWEEPAPRESAPHSPAAREVADQPAPDAEPAHAADWLEPVDGWEPEAQAPREPRPPRPREQPYRPSAPRPPEPGSPAPIPGGVPWIDPTLQRQSRPQFAPPVIPPRQAPRPPETTLLVDGTPHELTGDRVVLGRSRTADIVISDPSVSRQHCELRRDAQGWFATDLGSTNGSELDGHSLEQPRRLQPGQRLKLGHAAAIIEVR